jgi:UDP-2-acetamido-3-amino-2,3-dideoxy-glucuronate N-acetyltransferase
VRRAFWAHASAVVDAGARVGAGTKIWHFSHVMAGARVGAGCVLGQNVFVASGAVVGDGCRLQNNVSIYDGVTLEDEVFVGPSAVFTNVRTPRAAVSRKDAFVATRVGRGATIGANATIMCGVAIGAYALIGAGAVVTRDVEAHALVMGVPARRTGWACRCGERLADLDAPCAACGARVQPARPRQSTKRGKRRSRSAITTGASGHAMPKAGSS